MRKENIKQKKDLINNRTNWFFTMKRVETLADNIGIDFVEAKRRLSSHSALLWHIFNSHKDELRYGWNFIEVLSHGRCPVGIAVFFENDKLSIPIYNDSIKNNRLVCTLPSKKITGAYIKKDNKYTYSTFRKYLRTKVCKNPKTIKTINALYTSPVVSNGRTIPFTFAWTLVSGIMDK